MKRIWQYLGEKVDVFDGLRLTRKQNGGPVFCPVQELKKITKIQYYGRKKQKQIIHTDS